MKISLNHFWFYALFVLLTFLLVIGFIIFKSYQVRDDQVKIIISEATKNFGKEQPLGKGLSVDDELKTAAIEASLPVPAKKLTRLINNSDTLPVKGIEDLDKRIEALDKQLIALNQQLAQQGLTPPSLDKPNDSDVALVDSDVATTLEKIQMYIENKE